MEGDRWRESASEATEEREIRGFGEKSKPGHGEIKGGDTLFPLVMGQEAHYSHLEQYAPHLPTH